MTIDIFYKSYSKDFKLLHYSLKSIAKFITGYNNIILLIPEKDKHEFDTRDLPERTLIHYVNEYGNGYLFQQLCKMYAHKYSQADYILYADSDCIFDRPTDLQTLIYDGKPEILYTDYSKVGDAICWQAPTERFIGEAQQFEFMRRLPLIYHRTTLESIDGLYHNLEQIIMNADRFSEFNAMGAYAYKHEDYKYKFTNTDNWTYTDPISIQLWSHAKKNGSQLEQAEYNKALETINRIFELNLIDL